MRIVVDGTAAAPGSSAAVILEHFVGGWNSLGSDELHVVVGERLAPLLGWPDSVHVQALSFRGRRGRVLAQVAEIPRACRQLRADALVGLLPSTTLPPLPCPRVVLTFDLRYELLPHQFSFSTRWLRRVSYAIGWRQADAIACISERTRQDLLSGHPGLRRRPVEVAYLGADHVASWPRAVGAEPYAVAFGQYGHKNMGMVIEAWAELRDRGTKLPIRLIGMSDDARPRAEASIRSLGLDDLVTPMGWLFGDDLRQCFASAGLFVFPSDFEGFGLPAVEAMQLGVPLVISPEPALLEVTAGHATVMASWSAAALADAVEKALDSGEEELEAARRRASEFTWVGMATSVRALVTRVRKVHS